jgi:hypothetical protein
MTPRYFDLSKLPLWGKRVIARRQRDARNLRRFHRFLDFLEAAVVILAFALAILILTINN